MVMRFALVGVVAALALVSCGGDEAGTTASDQGNEEPTITIEGEEANDHGSEDVSGADEVEVEMDDFYFEPTILTGKPGQKITLKFFNEGDALHNFSLEEQGIDQDVDSDEKAQVKVAFPDSGTLLFVCKYHVTQGMRGGLEVSG